jgi:hypothetical protein
MRRAARGFEGESDGPAQEPLRREAARLLAETLDGLARVHRLRRVHAYQPDLLHDTLFDRATTVPTYDGTL